MMRVEISSPSNVTEQYSRKKIFFLWAAVTLPMILVSFLLAPVCIPRVLIAPILVYWVLFLMGGVWECLLALWLIRREEGNIRWETIRTRIWLNPPLNQRTGEAQPGSFLWLIPCGLIALFVLSLGVLLWALLPTFLEFIYPSPVLMQISRILLPVSANNLELASPEYAGMWWLASILLVGWIFQSFFAEEFFFRGVLLPKMNSSFGRWDWVANAFLFAFYYLFRPWMILFRMVGALLITALVRRFHSNWMAIAMRSVEAIGLLALLGYGVLQSRPAIPAPLALPHIEMHPAAWVCPWKTIHSLSEVASESAFSLDVRCTDISATDLRNSSVDPYSLTFDDGTIWPPAARMPSDVDWARIMDLGKNPGLGMRAVQQQGITGRGVGIAIIDQPLLTEHVEYAGQLRWYEEINSLGQGNTSMHGPAVASIAVGKTVGVAPEADLYYISLGDNPLTIMQTGHAYAAGIRRVLEINQSLPADRKIRVIAIAWGCSPGDSGCYDFLKAVKEAKSAGLFVISSSLEETEGLKFQALGRKPLANPDLFESYEPGSWWASDFYAAMDKKDYSFLSGRLLIPMDSRTTASPTGANQYVFYREGGWNWSIPYIAGMYALASQVNATITPEAFWAIALQTGRTIDVQHDGKTYLLGPILDPQALITALQAGK